MTAMAAAVEEGMELQPQRGAHSRYLLVEKCCYSIGFYSQRNMLLFPKIYVFTAVFGTKNRFGHFIYKITDLCTDGLSLRQGAGQRATLPAQGG